MEKKTAIAYLGGSVDKAASELGCSKPTVYRWPEKLPRHIADRVLAAIVRRRYEQLRTQGVRVSKSEVDAVSL